jgi:hypothetical protein
VKVLRRCGPQTYVKLEEASEVSSYKIVGEDADTRFAGGGFDFFRGLGIIGYEKTFKIWLRKFPRPIFIVTVEGTSIVSWVFIEEWPETASDGSPVYVLRAIETIPAMRKRRIGLRLLMLGLQQTVGYMVTKPLTHDAERFFMRAGFMNEKELRKPAIDLSKHPGYLVLPPFKKNELMEGMEKYFAADQPECPSKE